METHKLIELALTKAAEVYGLNWRDLFTVEWLGKHHMTVENKSKMKARTVAMYALMGVLSKEWVCDILKVSNRAYNSALLSMSNDDEQMERASKLRREVVELQLVLTKDLLNAA